MIMSIRPGARSVASGAPISAEAAPGDRVKGLTARLIP
jgi:hypothetical protein